MQFNIWTSSIKFGLLTLIIEMIRTIETGESSESYTEEHDVVVDNPPIASYIIERSIKSGATSEPFATTKMDWLFKSEEGTEEGKPKYPKGIKGIEIVFNPVSQKSSKSDDIYKFRFPTDKYGEQQGTSENVQLFDLTNLSTDDALSKYLQEENDYLLRIEKDVNVVEIDMGENLYKNVFDEKFRYFTLFSKREGSPYFLGAATNIVRKGQAPRNQFLFFLLAMERESKEIFYVTLNGWNNMNVLIKTKNAWVPHIHLGELNRMLRKGTGSPVFDVKEVDEKLAMELTGKFGVRDEPTAMEIESEKSTSGKMGILSKIRGIGHVYLSLMTVAVIFGFGVIIVGVIYYLKKTAMKDE